MPHPQSGEKCRLKKLDTFFSNIHFVQSARAPSRETLPPGARPPGTADPKNRETEAAPDSRGNHCLKGHFVHFSGSERPGALWEPRSRVLALSLGRAPQGRPCAKGARALYKKGYLEKKVSSFFNRHFSPLNGAEGSSGGRPAECPTLKVARNAD